MEKTNLKISTTKFGQFKIFAILFGLVLSLIAIVVLDVFTRYLPQPNWRETEKYSVSSISTGEKASSNNWKGAIKTFIPPGRPGLGFTPKFKEPTERLFDENKYYIRDHDLGFKFAPGKFHVKHVAKDRSVLFDVHYTIDPSGRRVTIPSASIAHSKKQILFFGCSFVFGIGINDDETLSSQVAAQTVQYEVFNYGVGGWGPNNLLRLLNSKSFGSDLPKKKGIAIYEFIDHHMDRIFGSLNLFQLNPDWINSLPFYFQAFLCKFH